MGSFLLASLGVTTIFIPFIILHGPTFIVDTDMSADVFIFAFVKLFMQPMICTQAYTRVLMYLERLAFRGWVKTLSRFMLISFFAIFYHWEQFIAVETTFFFWFATPFGLHLVLSLLWAAY